MTTRMCMAWGAFLALVVLLWGGRPMDGTAQTGEIVVSNEGKYIPYERTSYPEGPTDPASGVNVGDILNAHYYPGLKFYVHANYKYAKNEMDYFLERPQYIEKHPRRAQFLSIGHYIRGMILYHHASGMGRYALARRDFEEAIRWNAANHLAQLELAKMMAAAGQKDEAISTLNRLLGEKPAEKVAEDVKKELEKITSGNTE